jgi:hypothetical protein
MREDAIGEPDLQPERSPPASKSGFTISKTPASRLIEAVQRTSSVRCTAFDVSSPD